MLDHYHVLGSREENSRNRSVKVKIVFDFIFFVEMISKTIYGLGITVTSVTKQFDRKYMDIDRDSIIHTKNTIS